MPPTQKYSQAASEARFDDEMFRLRCAEWNLKALEAYKVGNTFWLQDTLGPQWKEAMEKAVTEGGSLFGEHRLPPQLQDPLLLMKWVDCFLVQPLVPPFF
jgi:hypothetical protein